MLRLSILLVLLGTACSGEPDAPPPGSISSVPLRERTVVDGPRFARLDPAVTGVDFENRLLQEHVIPYVYSGAGVAVGDYDQDGLPDLYLVSQDGPNKLFRQVAPFRFEDVTESAGGVDGGEAWGSAATFADVDGDGDLDLYVCNTEAPNRLYQNQGDGTFFERAGPFGLAVVAASSGAAFADYDNDGDLDLYVLTNRVFGPRVPHEAVAEVELPADTRKTLAELYPPEPVFGGERGARTVPEGHEDFFLTFRGRVFPAGQPDLLFRNDGYGRFTDVTKQSGIADQGQGLSVVWWDYDDDGWLDLYVANDLESPDTLYRNRGDGSFEDVTAKALPHTAYFGMGSDFGDIDNDGRFDLCVADMSSTTHYMSKMLMGNMSDRLWFLMHAEPPQYMRNALYVNTGTGRFLESAFMSGLASTDWTWTVLFADFDEDGLLDSFFTNGQPMFDNDPDAGAEFQRLWRAGARDKAMELYRSIGPVNERNIVRRNLGDLRFEDVGAEWGLDHAGLSHGAIVADLDRDGDLDVVTNDMNSPAAVYENRTADTHRVLVELRGTTDNAFGVGSRLTLHAGGRVQSRLVSLTRGYMSSGEAVQHFGLGEADRIDRLVVRWPNGQEQEFTDLGADRHYTIRQPAEDVPAPERPELEAQKTWFEERDLADVRHTERPFDDFAVQPLLPHGLSRLGPGLAFGDVDGDGRDDAWLGGAAGQAGSLLLAREGGGFEPVDGPWSDDAECEDMGALFVDHDRDGDLDLFVVSGGVENGASGRLLRDRLYVNEGGARFVAAAEGVLPERESSGSCAVAVDFDRDGDLDLFVGTRVVPGRFPESGASALLRNDEGRFVDVTDDVAPALAQAGMVNAAVWTDVDGDGWHDLVVAAQWQPLRVLRNENGASLRDATAEHGLDELRGQWNGVAAADLDGDGDSDLVVTNLGLNTKYRVKDGKPLRLFASDFDTDGTFDVVEAKHSDDALLPVRGRSCSSQAMPFIADRFKTFDAFARASLPEIYGQDALAGAVDLSVNELQHVVLRNDDGRFTVTPLPRIAQISPGFGVAIADFDGDGRQDLAIAQNFYSPEPETGRFASGLGIVLAGREGATFDAVPPLESGVVVPQDAMAATLVDLDGDAAPDFVLSLNDGPLRAFVSRPGDGRRLAVRLDGPDGNPTGVGARIALVAPDGAREVREIHAGSGYLSQSAPCAFFAAVPDGSSIEVRWPDGETTMHELAPDLVTMRIAR